MCACTKVFPLLLLWWNLSYKETEQDVKHIPQPKRSKRQCILGKMSATLTQKHTFRLIWRTFSNMEVVMWNFYSHRTKSSLKSDNSLKTRVGISGHRKVGDNALGSRCHLKALLGILSFVLVETLCWSAKLITLQGFSEIVQRTFDQIQSWVIDRC